MDFTAIKQIQETAHIPDLLRAIEEGADFDTALLPPGYTLASLEEFKQFANCYCLNFQTPMISDFLEYCKTNAESGARCFVDQDVMKAITIFDLGSKEQPGHKKHRATLALKQTAAYKAMVEATRDKMRQQAISDFLLDWEDCIVLKDSAGNAMTPVESATRLRDLTIETARSAASQVHDMGHEMSAMEKIEAANKETIPAELLFQCVPYHGLNLREFKMRISILTGHDTPMVKLRFVGFEQAQEYMAEEMREKITVGLVGSGITASIGTVQT